MYFKVMGLLLKLITLSFSGNTAKTTMNSGELKVDVPLASMESDCEEMANTDSLTNTPSKNAPSSAAASASAGHPAENKLRVPKKDPRLNFDGGDSLTGSLEDLVNSFDEKLTMCFQDYQEQVDKIAPVQVCIS